MGKQVAAGELFGPSIYNGPDIVGVPPQHAWIGTLYQVLVTLILGVLLFVLVWVGLKVSGRSEQAQQVKRKVLLWMAIVVLLAIIIGWQNLISIEPLVKFIAGDQMVVSSARAGRIVLRHKEAGADFIKVSLFLSREAFDGIVTTTRELGLPVAGHVSTEVGVEHSIKSGVDIQHTGEVAPYLSKETIHDMPIQKFDLLNVETKLPTLVALMQENGVAFTPTASLFYMVSQNLRGLEEVMAQPQNQYAHPAYSQAWSNPKTNAVLQYFNPDDQPVWDNYLVFQQRLVKPFFDAGVPLLSGTDISCVGGHVWGFATHVELQLFVDYGLTPYQALASATRVPADVMGGLDEWGIVEAGKRADLVLLQSNPLEDISNTKQRVGVMLRGEWFTQAELQQMLDKLAESYRAIPVGELKPVSGCG
jgi:hypothetical protein